MKKSIFLFFAAILCAMSVQGANTMRIYCKNTQSWWKSDNAAVGAYYWGTGGNANSWPGTRMTKVSGQTDLWYIDVDIDKYQNIIFTRVNGSGSVSDWGAKTGDLTIKNTQNQYTISSSSAVWGNPGVTGSWGTYKPASTAALATSDANIFVGGQTTLTASLTSNTSANTIKETVYAISPEGANVSGNTFTATAEGTYTITATVTYYPLGCPTLTSTATATTTITAEVPAEETHDVTVSYMFGETKVAEPTIVNTVGVETPVKVTAPEIAKYTFVNWTLGADVATADELIANTINITTKAGGSDFTLVANYEKAKLTYTVTVPAGTENCYLVGAMNDWDVENPIEMTKQGENVFTVTLEDVEKTDEYKYISQKGTWDYADVQEANRTWSANDVVTAWKDPLATNLYLRGGMNEWGTIDQFKKEAADAATATVIVELKADTTYEFKVASADWSEGYSSTTAFTATSTQTLSTDVQDNAKLTTVAAGDYTFTWNLTTKELTITYPELPKYQVTTTANPAAAGTVEGAGEYEQGKTATLTATANDHYVFVNWTKGEEVVSTENPYTFNVTDDVALVANFKLDSHTVTATAVNGSVTGLVEGGIYEHGAEITLTATPAEHYVFVNWTAGETVLSSENPYIFTLEKDVELTANFALDTHTVAAAAENGTVTGDGEYTHGTKVTLTATPAEGYEFVNWTAGKDTVSTEATYTFTVEADVNLVANFKKQIVHTDITAEDAIVRLIDGVLYFNGVLEDGTPYQVTLNEYTEVGNYTNISWTTYGEDEVEVVGAQANVNGEEGKLTLTATVANETNSYGLTISGILPAAEEDVKEVESLVYTLTPAKGSNSGYAGNCDITINDITWNLTGNSQMNPWRIGGKSITKVDRALYSKTPLAYNISKIEVTHGNASSITVNSFKLIISDEANGTGETIDVDFKASATTTIDLPEGDYTNKYFKFLYNVTNTNSSKNYFVEFTGAKFYATTTIEANPAPEAPAFTGEANFVGSTEVELTTTEENINIYYTLTDDYTLPTAGYMYAEPIELTETTTVKAIAHNTLTGKISEIAEKTFTKAEVYTITWSVNGDVSETTEVVQGNTLTLPADPTAPEACGSKVFMGWATTSSVNANGIDIEYVDNTTIPTGGATYYAVFAIQTAAGETEEIVDDYTMSDYTAGTQYATEEHKLDEKLTLYTVECHFTTQLRIYSSSTHNGYVYSNQLPAIIKSMSFTAGNKVDQLVVYGSTDGATWSEVGQISVTSTSYKTYELSFGNSDYTYFKLDVAGEQQIRISGFSITYKSGEAYTYSEYSTTCSGTGTDVENIEVKGKSVKMIVNGQLIIIKNGVTYNAQGQVVK